MSKMSIRPALGRQTNTYEMDLEVYEHVDSGGIIESKLRSGTLRFTSDSVGETLSVQCGDTMYAFPFEPVTKLIDYTRRHRK